MTTPKLLVLSFALATWTACSTYENAAPTAPNGKSWSQRLSNPVSQPTIFESPTIQREIRPVVIHQNIPSSSVFQGGDFQVYAVQLRIPIDDKLAFIATKDGFIDLNPDAAPDEDGWADIAAGFRYAIHEDDQFLVTPGFIFEFDSGDHEVFQGNGDGLLRPFVSAGWEPEEKINVLGNLGYNLPMHGSRESHSVDYHAHVDYEVNEQFAPLLELNGITYTRSGNSAPGVLQGFEGGDLINLGSAGVAGQTVITGAAGVRVRISEQVSIGATYGFPLTDREDLFKDRITVTGSILF